MNHKNSKPQKGFTLIELSIVIVIIGLIVAGVVGGQTLVKQSQIRSQIAQLDNYKTAYNTFKLKYSAVPGDFAKASQYWPGVANGDGNNKITDDCNAAHETTRENLKFFHHLSEAKLISDNFNGTWEMGVGYPELKVSPRRGMVACGLILSGHTSGEIAIRHQISLAAARKPYRVVMALNVNNPDGINSAYNDFIGTSTPKTYQNIDKKIDDGLASSGKFIGYSAWESTLGATGDCLDGVDGDYNIANDQFACNAIYEIE